MLVWYKGVDATTFPNDPLFLLLLLTLSKGLQFTLKCIHKEYMYRCSYSYINNQSTQEVNSEACSAIERIMSESIMYECSKAAKLCYFYMVGL